MGFNKPTWKPGRELRPVAGAGASQLFAVGLLGASVLAATVVPLSSAYAIAETAGVERSLSRKLREAPVFYGIFTMQLVIGAIVALLPGNLVDLVINAQVLNGFITPVLLTYLLILANRRSVLGAAASKPVFRAVATVSVAVVAVLSATVLVQTVAGWL
jgi:Mn2+/Fe2+ NRAMP family transporter